MTDVSERAHQYLNAWFSQMPTFALMGEFSAGKSTLLNLIIGEAVLPTKVTATNMPVIWMTYGETISAQSLSYEGELLEFDYKDLAEQGPKGHLLIRLTLPSETLRRSDVIDTPGISDRRMSANALNFIQPYLDFVVWCSAANQAWRQSEKAVWQKMPAQVYEQSVLALTRADMMTKSNDLQKVVKRCETETDGTFRVVQPIATVVAQKALNAEGEVIDQAAWDRSHASALFSQIKDSLRMARLNSALRPKIDISTIEPFVPVAQTPEESAVEDTVIVAESTPETGENTIAEGVKKDARTQNVQVDTLLCQLRQMEDDTGSKEQFSTNLEHLFSKFSCDPQASDAHQLVLNRAMSLDGCSKVPPNLVKAQLVRELEDFAHNHWCQLDKVH